MSRAVQFGGQRTPVLRKLMLGALCAVGIALGPAAQAYTNTFDTADSINGWVHWWGGAVELREFDATMDADGNPNSGSLRVVVPFDRSLADNQFSMWGSFSGTPNSWNQRLNGANFSRVEMDIYWDPFSPTNAAGNYGNDFRWGFAVGDPVYGQVSFNNHTTIAANEAGQWIHLSAVIDPTAIGANITNLVGIWIKMWTGSDPNSALESGAATFWVDNIRLHALPPPPPDYVNMFDTADSLNGWTHWWGGAMETREFDAAMDANNNANSGSMKVTVPYRRSLGGDNQFSMWGSFSGTVNSWGAPLDGTQYTNLSMDIYWDPASPRRPVPGDYGNDFRYGFAVGQPIYGQISFNNHTTIAASDVGKWIHLSAPIDLATVGPNITNIVGVWIKMWTGGDPNTGLDGDAIFWVDNIKLTSKATNAPPPQPQMEIEPVKTRGLKLFASALGSQYQRQGIRTANPAYSWHGATGPVTYSVTIAENPRVEGFQVHLFLVPGLVGANVTAVDYTQPHVVFLDIRSNNDGTAYAAFRYKTNEPNANAFLYGAGSIATLGAPTVLGTWSLTFNPAGDIRVTSPSGTSTNFTMPAEALAFFADPVYAYFGVQPNAPGNIGRSATLSRIQVTGVATPIDETFTTPLDSNVWEVSAEHPAGVIVVTPEALAWVNWTLPDIGFKLQTSQSLAPTAWTDLALPSPQLGNRKRTLILESALPASTSGTHFFRLTRP